MAYALSPSSPAMLRALGVVALFLMLLVAYGVAIEPRLLLDEQAIEAEVPGLPTGWDGQTLALVADFQTGMWLDNSGMVQTAVGRAIEERAALALIGGDFVYQPDSATVREAVSYVRPLVAAGIPTVAVLGNHDYSLMKKDSAERPPMAEYLAAQLREAGVTVLENDAVAVEAANGDPLWVAGVGSVWAENAAPAAALAAVPAGAPRVWLMHNAEAFREVAADEAPLALAAHSHGGQIRLPGTGTWSWLDVVRPGEVVADGWAADSIGAPGNRLYVNRGIGFSTVPVRIRCRPELTLVTLRAAGGTLPDRGPTASR